MQFYILMVDYGKRPANGLGAYGLEAVSSPEKTRRQIVSEVRDILASDNKTVAFVKFVDGNFIEDVSADIIEEAECASFKVAQAMSDVTRIEAGIDRVADYRKHGRV